MVTREVSQAVRAYLADRNGRGILSAPVTVELLRAAGVDAWIDVAARELCLGPDLAVDLYSDQEQAASLQAEGRGGYVQCTEELLVEELDLAYALHMYCFREHVHSPSRGRGSPSVRCASCSRGHPSAFASSRRTRSSAPNVGSTSFAKRKTASSSGCPSGPWTTHGRNGSRLERPARRLDFRRFETCRKRAFRPTACCARFSRMCLRAMRCSTSTGLWQTPQGATRMYEAGSSTIELRTDRSTSSSSAATLSSGPVWSSLASFGSVLHRWVPAGRVRSAPSTLETRP